MALLIPVEHVASNIPCLICDANVIMKGIDDATLRRGGSGTLVIEEGHISS